MVVFEVTPKMKELLEATGTAHQCRHLPNGLMSIGHASLLEAVAASESPAESFLWLTRGSKIYGNHEDACAAHQPSPQRSSDLENRLAVLRIQSEEREYAAIVRGITAGNMSNAELESARLGQFGAQMSLGVNVIVTMATCFVAGYFVFKHSSGRQSFGLVGGVVCMIIAMAVEVTLVITKMYSIEKALEKDGKRQSQHLSSSQRERRIGEAPR